MLTCASAGDTLILKVRSGSVFVKSLDPGVHKALFEASKHLCSWEISRRVKRQELEPDLEQQTSSKLGKHYVNVVYCHSAF